MSKMVVSIHFSYDMRSDFGYAHCTSCETFLDSITPLRDIEKVEKAAADTTKKATKTVAATAKKVEKAAADTTKKATKTVASTTKKAAAAVKAVETEVYVQFQGREVALADLIDRARKAAGAKGAMKLYVKPEDGACYYVDGDNTGKIEF